MRTMRIGRMKAIIQSIFPLVCMSILISNIAVSMSCMMLPVVHLCLFPTLNLFKGAILSLFVILASKDMQALQT